jgi:hypothetical protein
MQRLRLPAVSGFLAMFLALAGAAHAGPFRSVAYAFAPKDDGKLAVFTCKGASDGQCYVKVGAGNGGVDKGLTLKVGEAVELPVSDASNTLCYSADPDIDWPDCTKSDLHLDLTRKTATSGDRVYFGSKTK